MTDTTTLETTKSAAIVVGALLGVVPFPAHAFDFRPVLSPTARLPDPWWWAVSIAVCVVAMAVWATAARAKRQAGG